MPNWCYTNYAVEGNEKELETLYKTMDELEEKYVPATEDSFQSPFLGCLINALGGNYEKYGCRGEYYSVNMVNGVIRFETKTAWEPCWDVIEFLKGKFPSLKFYYRAEEEFMGFLETNDKEGKYFQRFKLSAVTPVGLITSDRGDVINEYFSTIEELIDWFRKHCGVNVNSIEDVEKLNKKWQKNNAFCYVNVFTLLV